MCEQSHEFERSYLSNIIVYVGAFVIMLLVVTVLLRTRGLDTFVQTCNK